jgi:hypothetical protein
MPGARLTFNTSSSSTARQTRSPASSRLTDPAFQAEIISIMKNNNTLGNFVNSVGTNLAFNNSWLSAAKSALHAADSSGVLAPDQVNGYLRQLGGSWSEVARLLLRPGKCLFKF